MASGKAATVRISPATHETLRDLATQTGDSMQAVLDRALEDYRRRVFLEGLSDDFAALRRDPQAWQDELEERRIWDATLSDGLEPE